MPNAARRMGRSPAPSKEIPPATQVILVGVLNLFLRHLLGENRQQDVTSQVA